MAHKRLFKNYRVEVETESPWRDEHQQWFSALNEIRQQIRRHCDGLASVTVQYDAECVCEHCGAKWTEETSSPHNGGCCDKDCENMPDEQTGVDTHSPNLSGA